MRALVVNAGNANAGTGERGLADARATCVAVAALLDCAADAVLPFSTGVIMEPLPVDRIVAALPACRDALARRRLAGRLARDHDHRHRAQGRIAPDRARWRVDHGDGHRQGRGHDRPEHGDHARFHRHRCAYRPTRCSQALVAEIADASFNRITIDGDTSTNDSFVLFSTHRAPVSPLARRDDPRLAAVKAAISGVAVELAQAIVRDGEGATKFIAVVVEGGRDVAECDRSRAAIAHSPLVKTAFFASDPNLGRIVCAIGNAEIPDLDPGRVSFWLDDVLVVADGARATSYREEDGKRVMAGPEIGVRVALGRGPARTTVWTCDLSHDYVRINADYRS